MLETERFIIRDFRAEDAADLVASLRGRQRIHRLNAYCDPRNKASWRVLEKTGFVREGHFREKGTFRDDAEGRPIWHDCYAYGQVMDEG